FLRLGNINYLATGALREGSENMDAILMQCEKNPPSSAGSVRTSTDQTFRFPNAEKLSLPAILLDETSNSLAPIIFLSSIFGGNIAPAIKSLLDAFCSLSHRPARGCLLHGGA